MIRQTHYRPLRRTAAVACTTSFLAYRSKLKIDFCQRTLSNPGGTLGLACGQTTMERGTAATTAVGDDVLKCATKLHVEDGVEDRIDGRVGIAEPEQERVQPVRQF